VSQVLARSTRNVLYIHEHFWYCRAQVMNEQDVRLMFGQVQGEVPGSPVFAMALAPPSRHLEVQLICDMCVSNPKTATCWSSKDSLVSAAFRCDNTICTAMRHSCSTEITIVASLPDHELVASVLGLLLRVDVLQSCSRRFAQARQRRQRALARLQRAAAPPEDRGGGARVRCAARHAARHGGVNVGARASGPIPCLHRCTSRFKMYAQEMCRQCQPS